MDTLNNCHGQPGSLDHVASQKSIEVNDRFDKDFHIKQADPISIVCIQKSENCEDLSQFSKSNGFVLLECDNF